jgi:hypothetical protein
MATYYLDGTTLTNSTSIFSDVNLSICAPDGFYSDGVISRELSGCVLLPQQVCGTCAQPCDGTINANENQGCFILDIDLGGTNNDTGAVVVTFNPASIPDGIIVTYDGVNYNKLVSAQFGVLQANNNGVPDNSVPTFLGSVNGQGTCSGNSLLGTYTLNEKEYLNGAFVSTGNQQTITITDVGSQLTSARPNNCKLVVPKPQGSPSTMRIQLYGPCGDTAWSLSIDCPTILNSFQGSTVQSDLACHVNPSTTYYHVPITGTASSPALNDMIFIDPNGAIPASDGIINLSGNPHPYIVVQNGVVVNTGNCVPDGYLLVDCITGNQQKVSNSSYPNFDVNDVVQYKIGTPGSGTVRCGTITDKINSQTYDATLDSGVAYACDDTVHCPT